MYLSPVLGILAGADSINLIEAITRAGLDNILLVKAKNPVYLTGGVDATGFLKPLGHGLDLLHRGNCGGASGGHDSSPLWLVLILDTAIIHEIRMFCQVVIV